MSIIEKALEKTQDEAPVKVTGDATSGDAMAKHLESADADDLLGVAKAPAQDVSADAPSDDDAKPASRLVSALRGARTRGLPSDSEPQGPTIDLDLGKLRALGIITPDDQNSALVEQHRLLKRPLLAKAPLSSSGKKRVKKGNLIVVTSSLPGEGKTFISINLAMSIAMEVDRTVLLIDADPAKSDVSRVFGVETRDGLMDYLSGAKRNLPELLLKTNIPKLSLFPSGKAAPNATELLASDQMVRLTEELSERYPERIVIFDSPPLLATSGAGVLVGLMGQVVMVVEAVRTPQTAVEEALEVMGPRDNVGLVLNKQRGATGNRYGYGYGYQYGETNK